jgi:hypothetical protein
MKTLQKIVLSIGLIGLLNSCQSTNQVLSKSDKRMEIMNTIANDESMSKEMMGILMKSNMGKKMMQEKEGEMMKNKHAEMMKMMKENPEMMKSMMSKMMETAKDDKEMMSGMCKEMMGNEKMMEMMEKMKGDKMEKKLVKEEDHKSHH